MPPFYTITYVLDGEVYATETLECGTKIVPPVIPGLEDYTIWEDVPETMPAKDITIYGKAKEIIDSLTPNPSPRERGAVYDLSGRKMFNVQSSMFNGLKNGIYIQNGRKVAVKWRFWSPALFLALFASSHGVLATYDAEAVDEGEEAVLVDIVGARITTAELWYPTADVALLA